MTKSEFLKRACAHALRRWCWDDTVNIEEDYTRCPPDKGQSPEAWIDELARDYDLIDPKEGWG